MRATHAHASAPSPGVNFYGPLGIVGGLGSAARGHLAALEAASVPVSVIPVNEMFVHHSGVGLPQPKAERPKHRIAFVHANANSVERFLYFRARSFARSQYSIGFWVWELPALRDEWWSELRRFDEVWVPSTFCQRAVSAVTAKPVTVIPYVVSPIDAPDVGFRKGLQIADKAFVFLYMFDAGSFMLRKNPQCLIDAFEAAFPDNDSVRLVLKVSNAYLNPELSEYLSALIERDPRCVVLRQTMSGEEVAILIEACDCYVSPHRSEGFGLTVAEAMAQGVPVIATDYSGVADFLSPDVGYPLRYRLTEIEEEVGPYPKGAIWADPSREHLRDLMREVAQNPEAAAVKAQRARQRILRDYSPKAVGQRMADRLAGIALR